MGLHLRIWSLVITPFNPKSILGHVSGAVVVDSSDEDESGFKQRPANGGLFCALSVQTFVLTCKDTCVLQGGLGAGSS